MMNNKIWITGCHGSGINHIRLLLGMSPGKEIIDLSGRRVADVSKLDFVMRVMYHDSRIFDGTPPVRNSQTNTWRRQSYWLRMEWLTREKYTETEVRHSYNIVRKKQSDKDRTIFLQVGDVDRVTQLYRTKCPDLNGRTYEEEFKENLQWQTVPEGVDAVVVTDELYRRDWVSNNLLHLLDQIGYAPADPSETEKIHHRWCDLNDQLFKRTQQSKT